MIKELKKSNAGKAFSDPFVREVRQIDVEIVQLMDTLLQRPEIRAMVSNRSKMIINEVQAFESFQGTRNQRRKIKKINLLKVIKSYEALKTSNDTLGPLHQEFSFKCLLQIVYLMTKMDPKLFKNDKKHLKGLQSMYRFFRQQGQRYMLLSFQAQMYFI